MPFLALLPNNFVSAADGGAGGAGMDPALLEHLVIVQNGSLRVGILPSIGGRVVLLQMGNGPNLLHSNPQHWTPEARPDMEAAPTWKAFDGHIYWLSPQEGWWSQQEGWPELSGANWPPDPYLIYAPYEIRKRTSSSLTLISPPSPVSGIRMEKQVRVYSPGEVRLTATMTNIREEPVTWGLWSNTRFSDSTPFAVACPGLKEDETRYDKPGGMRGIRSPDGLWYTFPQTIEKARPEANKANKVFLALEEREIHAWPIPGIRLRKVAGPVDPGEIHSSQAPVEIYLQRGATPEEGLLELEFHGPVKRLQPGQSLSLEESWFLDEGAPPGPFVIAE
jgi:hypothetical protein